MVASPYNHPLVSRTPRPGLRLRPPIGPPTRSVQPRRIATLALLQATRLYTLTRSFEIFHLPGLAAVVCLVLQDNAGAVLQRSKPGKPQNSSDRTTLLGAPRSPRGVRAPSGYNSPDACHADRTDRTHQPYSRQAENLKSESRGCERNIPKRLLTDDSDYEPQATVSTANNRPGAPDRC